MLTKGSNDQHVTASAYVPCAYAYVASENQALSSFIHISGLFSPQVTRSKFHSIFLPAHLPFGDANFPFVNGRFHI